ncbi:MAG: hypothetical protein VKN60_08225 [Cyanobacteriota bacterium]|nr:hypothetical protein [Cyanobacteriota bacterium]
MKTANFLTSSCRHCRYYQAEGRRGGMCHQLNVPVQGEWSACTLAARPFANAWESLEDVVRLEQTLNLNYDGERTSEAAPTVEHPWSKV